MRKRMFKNLAKCTSILLSLTMIAGLMGGCGSSKKESGSKDSNKKEVIKIWHDGDEAIMKSITDSVNTLLKEDNIEVSFEKKTGLTDQLKLYGSDSKNGLDMYFYANDSVGMFSEMGILAELTDLVDDDTLSKLDPMTVKAGNYKDKQYLLPVYFETLLFMYNKDLWTGEVPSTTEDLYKYMKDNTDASASKYAVVNQHSTAYNVAPVINGFGGCIIDESGKPGLSKEDTIKAIEYNKKFAKLQADGDYNTVTTLFNEGKAAAIIGGPWLISDIKKANINLGIKSLSSFSLPNGKQLAPFAGVQGVGVMKYAAEGKKDAVKKVLKALTDVSVGINLAKNNNCAPACVAAYDNADVSGNEMITAIKETAKTAQPMPNVPELSVMWTPTESLLAAVNKSDADLNSSAKKYQEEAEAAIKDMK